MSAFRLGGRFLYGGRNNEVFVWSQVCRMSSFPRLESATGRARTRRRRVARLESLTKGKPMVRKFPKTLKDDDNVLPPYPKGRPWRVLWPHPHGNPTFVVETKLGRRFPRWRDIRNGWANYMETWEDGLRGEPSPEKLRERQTREAAKASGMEETSSPNFDNLEANVTQNLKVARDSGEDLLEQAKEKTGIRSRDGLQKTAGEMMKLATECLREFMAGYREGRDREVDKMLHEYFQDDPTDKEQKNSTSKPRKRKPRRAVLR